MGIAYSAVSVVGTRLYTMLATDADEFTVCLDVADGSEIWREKTGPRFDNDRGSGPRSTPTVHEGKVYVLSGVGVLHALDAETGDILWSRDFVEEFDSNTPGWGFSGSPLVEGDLVMVEAGGKESGALAAFNKDTGDIAWTAGAGDAAYSSPVAITYNGTRQVLFLTPSALTSVAPADGTELWSYAWGDGINIATPLFVPDDLIFVSASYDKGSAVVRMSGQGDALAVEEVWASRVMRNHFNSSVLLDGYLYGFDNANLKCIEAATGHEEWSKARTYGKGSLVRVGDRLIVLGEEGLLALIDATPDKYRRLARVQMLDGRCWTPPTVAHGKLYLRNQEELVCLDVSASQ
jgi:outer membrane protein assembly factor BamB